jgi:hypothetical protein
VVECARCGLDIRSLIINNAVVHAYCEFDRLRCKNQRGYTNLLANECRAQISMTQLPLLPYEAVGIERLRELEKLLFSRELATAHLR